MSYPESNLPYALLIVASMCTACSDRSEPAVEDAGATPPAAEAPAEVADTSGFPTDPLIDPNTASVDELDAIAGMTEEACAAIVASRPFESQSSLHATAGDLLSESGQEQVYARLFVKVGLNSGANEDYQLIPSTLSPQHLAHEFEEYRPYDSMDQFRREMAKYVEADEVEYLTRFVTLD